MYLNLYFRVLSYSNYTYCIRDENIKKKEKLRFAIGTLKSDEIRYKCVIYLYNIGGVGL